MTPHVTVTFIDEVIVIEPGATLTFGRDADLVIDTNRFLHRRLGRIADIDGSWRLINLGSSIPLEIIDTHSPSRLNLAPGASIPLPFESFRIVFRAGQSAYELAVETDAERSDTERTATTQRTGATTISAASTTLNTEQRLLLVSLAEDRLRTGTTIELPTNREVAARLGWTLTKFNRKLDNLCVKFDRLGIRGLKGDLGGLATSRRDLLIDYVVTTGIISTDDLELLEEFA